MRREDRKRVVIKGAGDLASGIALRLFRCGFDLVMTETAVPTTVRRTVAFSPAVYQGTVQVEDVTGVRCDSMEVVEQTLKERKIAVVVDEEVTNKELTSAIKSACGKHFDGVELFDVYRSEQLGENEKSLAYKIRLISEEKTLTTEEINTIVNKVLRSLEFRYRAKLRV